MTTPAPAPVKPIPTVFYANQCVAYIPINQIGQYGVPVQAVQSGQSVQQLQHPHIVDVGGAFYPNAAALVQPLPAEKGGQVTGTQSLPNMPNKSQQQQQQQQYQYSQQMHGAIPSIPMAIAPLHPSKQPMTALQSNENQDSNQDIANESKSSEDKSSTDQDAEVITNENVLSQPQVMMMPAHMAMNDSDILQSIDYEKKTVAHKQEMLEHDVKKYEVQLADLKKGCDKSCKRLKLLLSVYGDTWKQDLIELLRAREFEFNTYSETYAQRMFHARQLEVVEGEHYNLTALAESLSLRLRTVVNEYQSLNATIDLSGGGAVPYNPDGAMAISNNVHFKQLIAANRKTERQIKFMKTIIENELERNDDGCGQMESMQMQMNDNQNKE